MLRLTTGVTTNEHRTAQETTHDFVMQLGGLVKKPTFLQSSPTQAHGLIVLRRLRDGCGRPDPDLGQH